MIDLFVKTSGWYWLLTVVISAYHTFRGYRVYRKWVESQPTSVGSEQTRSRLVSLSGKDLDFGYCHRAFGRDRRGSKISAV